MSIDEWRWIEDPGKTTQDELQYYKNQAAQRGARMQMLREWFRIYEWDKFVRAHPEAKDWFDEDGVPK